MFSKKYRNLVWISADVDLLLQRLASDRIKLSFMSFQSVEGTGWWGTLRWCNFTLRQTVPGRKKITKRCLNKLPQRFEIRLAEEHDGTSTVWGSSLKKSKTKQNNGYNSLHNIPNKPGSSLSPLSPAGNLFRVYVLVWICAKVSQMMQHTRVWRGGIILCSYTVHICYILGLGG